uniref:Uncharacterized protein n=1 Tax=uncultured marine virus TaxID=186617 RepID=A0A0F7L4A4_9VIRU|nr:hypothetical protein [uncultured marine virus]
MSSPKENPPIPLNRSSSIIPSLSIFYRIHHLYKTSFVLSRFQPALLRSIPCRQFPL